MGASAKASTMLYKEVVQVVLLYGREIWVVPDAMMMVLEVFHHRIDRCIAGMTVSKGKGEE